MRQLIKFPSASTKRVFKLRIMMNKYIVLSDCHVTYQWLQTRKINQGSLVEIPTFKSNY